MWAVLIFAFGFFVKGINNWGHGGGFAAGVLLGLLLGYEEKYRDIKIVDYEVTEIRLDDSKKSARVTVSFSWHPLDETIIREAVVVDTWKSSKSRWYRESQEVLSGEIP